MSNTRIDQITFTRFIAAIAVVVFHFGLNTTPFNNELISFLFKEANVGVSYFFLLSGFVMVVAYIDKPELNLVGYYKARFFRIYPVYFIALLLVFLYFVEKNRTIDTIGLGMNLLVIQAWFPGKALTLNFPGWSLAVEFFFYAIYPFLFNALYKKRDIKSLALPILLFWIISQYALYAVVSSSFYQGYPSKSYEFAYYFPFMHLNQFLIGNLAALFFHKYKKKSGNYDIAVIVVFLLIVAALKYPLGLIYHNGLLALLFIPFILLLSFNQGVISSLFRKKFFCYLGDISYSIYILQVPVYMWIDELFKYFRINDALMQFYFSLVMLILFSALTFSFIDVPLREKIKRVSIKNNKR